MSLLVAEGRSHVVVLVADSLVDRSFGLEEDSLAVGCSTGRVAVGNLGHQGRGRSSLGGIDCMGLTCCRGGVVLMNQ